MGYCTYGGKLVPGNTQASCIGGGGNWVGGETGPDTQVSMPPIGSPIQLPNIGRPPIRPEPDRGIPGYRAPQISQSPERMWDNTDDFGNRINTNFAGYSRRDADNQREDILNNLGAKRVNFGSKTPTNTNPGFFESAKMRTNALNNPPKDSMGLFGDKPTIPYTEGDSIFGTGTPEPSFLDKLRKDYGDVKKAFEGQFKSSYNGYYNGVETPWDELPPGAQFGHNLEKFFPATVAGATWLGEQLPDSFMQSDFAKQRGQDILTNPLTKIPETAIDVAALGYFPTKGALLAAGKLVTTVVGSGGTQMFLGYAGIKYASNQEAVDSFIDKYTGKLKDKVKEKVNTLTGNTPKEGTTTTTTTPTGKDTTDVSQPTNTGKNNIFGDGTPSGPSVINAAKKGNISTGLLDKMGTKDFWMTGIEGGSGSWDNRLFRLGEMMSYMGKHPSKQGDSPAKRWTTANTAANTLKASANKAKKTPTPLKIDNIGAYITKKMEDDVGSGFFNWNGMSAAEIKAATAIINTNITKQVRVAEGVEGEGEIDIKMIADEEIAKYLKSIGQI